MIRQTDFDIATYSETMESMLGWTTLTDGIGIYLTEDNEWCISHTRSGLALCFCDNPEMAQSVAAALGGMDIDWTLSACHLLDKREDLKSLLSLYPVDIYSADYRRFSSKYIDEVLNR